ncbi:MULTISPECIES: glycosyltransferase [Enterobacter cloacae complex]|uniref:glycosyltransferase n=1 Tax=Enterobacter cloacae complex TaxID=354276 RepID=UPI001C7DEBDE|nr:MULTISPECIES: glycosyltransferase [Enterobacter cloacae complex]MDT7032640.1 glycosyltransferase [Enterobacter hormaechei]
MKVLILNTQESFGGAAIAAKRLHDGLLRHGVDSSLFVMNKETNKSNIYGPDSKLERIISRLRAAIDSLPLWGYRHRSGMFSVAWWNNRKLVRRINESNCDVVHLHWVNAGFLSVHDISRIKKPVIITLHDMWYFTGGCHYTNSCEGFKQDCGNCPLISSNFKYDISFIKRRQKRSVYAKTNATFIALSHWIYNEINSSKIAVSNKKLIIPNPIHLEKYVSIPKNNARVLLDLPLDKKIVMFGAVNSTSDSRKGYKELKNALKEMEVENLILVIFGSSTSDLESELKGKYKVVCLGFLNDELTARIAYSAADVMVVPSLEENLSNTIIESLACNTPVVAFDIGGNKDMIDHKKNGYLAKFDLTGKTLAQGILYTLDNKSELSLNARKTVEDKFDEQIIIPKYIKLYSELFSKGQK